MAGTPAKQWSGAPQTRTPGYCLCAFLQTPTQSLSASDQALLPFRYRKIPGDKCQGGMNPAREVKDLKKKCTSNFLNPTKQDSRPQGHSLSQNPAPPPLGYTENTHFLSPTQKQNSKSNSVPIILAIVGLMLVTVVAGVLIVKKYVCGGRFLVHRYSVLQQHAEADGVEALDSTSHAKSGYHDDSDEDLLE